MVAPAMPHSQALSSKTRGGESLVTFARKAVYFQRVIHVINVGRSYFSNNCQLPNSIDMLAAQAIYNFAFVF